MSLASDLIGMGERLFSKRDPLLAFWQMLFDQFDPVGADFTTEQSLGEDFASKLMTSYPIIVARELTDTFSHILRPSDRVWAEMGVEGLKDHDGRIWLQEQTRRQRRAMYDRKAQFVKAAKAGDKNFGIAGQCVITVEYLREHVCLLYRNWHLKNVVWTEDLTGAIECVHHKLKYTAYDLARIFGKEKLHAKVSEQLEKGKDPHCEVNCRRVVIPTDMYHGETKFRTPLVSVYIDVDNEHIIEERALRTHPYVIPRWQQVGGSQYAVSPAAVCALPEARLLQAMCWTTLEAGEKAVNPPMVAAQEAFRGDIDLRAGGITYYSADYDERQGEVLRPVGFDKSGLPLGLELMTRSEEMLRKAFYADKLQMPQRGGPQETAYEVGQRIQQFIRDALPLVEPMETEYSIGLCETTFNVMAENGGFGTPDTWPDSLRGEQIEFKFSSPLRDAADKEKAQIFLEAGQLISSAVALDPGAGAVVDASVALRDALYGIGVPVRWTRSEEDAQAINDQHAQQVQQQQQLEMLGQAATAAKDLGAAQATGGV